MAIYYVLDGLLCPDEKELSFVDHAHSIYIFIFIFSSLK